VQDPSAVDVGQRLGQELAELDHALDRERAPAELVLQRASVDERHDEGRRRAGHDVEGRDHVPVLEGQQRLGFAAEALDVLGLEGGYEGLERDLPLSLAVPGAVHDPAPAPTDHPAQLVARRLHPTA